MFTPLEVLRRHGFIGELAVHDMPWFKKGGDPKHYHPNIAYSSDSWSTIALKLNVIQSVGASVVLMTYQGPFNSFPNSAVFTSQQCAARGIKFGLVMDPWAAKAGPNGSDLQKNMQAVLNHPDVQNMLSAPNYLPEGYLLDFNTGVDYTKLALPKSVKTVLALNGMFDATKQKAPGFSWSHDDPDIDPIASMKSCYASNDIRIGHLCRGFMDGGNTTNGKGLIPDLVTGVKLDLNSSNFNNGAATRYTNNRAGNYLFDQLAILEGCFSKLKYVAWETWSDYNEGSEIESLMSFFADVRLL